MLLSDGESSAVVELENVVSGAGVEHGILIGTDDTYRLFGEQITHYSPNDEGDKETCD